MRRGVNRLPQYAAKLATEREIRTRNYLDEMAFQGSRRSSDWTLFYHSFRYWAEVDMLLTTALIFLSTSSIAPKFAVPPYLY